MGWAIPHRRVLKIYLYFVPIMIIQWWINSGTCVLTNIEYALKGIEAPKSEQQGAFIKKILGVIFDTIPSDQAIQIGLYILLGIFWTGAWFHWKKAIKKKVTY